MERILRLRKHRCVKRLGIFLITVALVAGMPGCVAEIEPTPPIQYNLTVSSTAGGSVTTPGEGISVYDEGTAVSLVASPDIGYRFVNWTGDADTVADVSAASTTITMNGDYSITANFEEDQVVIVIDPALEAEIRRVIGKAEGPIYASELERVTALELHARHISDLSGLEYCTNLIHLYLTGNQISDISPLAGLTNLTYLALSSNQISDISPLANLTNLRWLRVWRNKISDIKPLVDNPGLGEGDIVALWGNPLSSDSINIYIPHLQARGVNVHY